MKKAKVHKNIFLITIFLLLLTLFLYYCTISYMYPGNLRELSLSLLPEFIGSLFLGLIVLLVGNRLEEKRILANKRRNLEKDLIIFKSNLENIFYRSESDWNFKNRTQSFYFDGSHINKLNDFFSFNNRKWVVFLDEYRKFHEQENKLIDLCRDFIFTIKIALIDAEKLDRLLKKKIIFPKLAASKGSHHISTREKANKNSRFEYLVTRGTWAGMNHGEVLFNIAGVTDVHLGIDKIENIMESAKSLSVTDQEFEDLVSRLQKNRLDLNNIVEKIEKHLKSLELPS